MAQNFSNGFLLGQPQRAVKLGFNRLARQTLVAEDRLDAVHFKKRQNLSSN